jgi:predicted PurR-regulated permease PerM
MFMTFVFAYIQTQSVSRLKPLIRNRSARVVLVAFFFLGIMGCIGLFIVPEVKNQTEMFVKQFGIYVSRVYEEIIAMSERYPVLENVIPQLKQNVSDGGPEDPAASDSFSPTLSIVQDIFGMGSDQDGPKITHIIGQVQNIGKMIAGIASAFLLALLFSFLIVFDLPNLSEKVKSLEKTKLRFIYDEVADGIYNFSKVLGQAFEAQFFIALANTLLTAIGIFLIGLGKHVAFLSMIVFLCSFIPVAGVFISSIPICLIALQFLGLKTMFLAIIMIIVIHLIEGYVLNPRIYGSRMRINPVIVLFILTIAGKLFHIWGLVLGVPVFSYIFGHAIQLETKEKQG